MAPSPYVLKVIKKIMGLRSLESNPLPVCHEFFRLSGLQFLIHNVQIKIIYAPKYHFDKQIIPVEVHGTIPGTFTYHIIVNRC